MTLSEVATAAGLARPTARRLLLTLEELGYVRSVDGGLRADPEGARPRDGLRRRRSGCGTSPARTWRRWSRRTGESSSMAQLDGSDIVYVARVAVPKIIALRVDIGTRFPAAQTSQGKVLLAALPPDELDAVARRAEPVRAAAVHRPAAPSSCTRELTQVRARGWALADEELAPGVRSVAAPVRDGTGAVRAAMNVTVHAAETSSRPLLDEHLPLLLRTAGEVSADWALWQSRPHAEVDGPQARSSGGRRHLGRWGCDYLGPRLQRPPLSGQVALVSGASRGLGRACAIELAAAGAHVVCTGAEHRGRRDPDRGATPDAGADRRDDRCRGRRGRVATMRPHRAGPGRGPGRAASLESHGRLDILVNNAWGGHDHHEELDGEEVWDEPMEQFRAMLLAGAYSDYVTSLTALRLAMGPAGRGTILTTTWHTPEPPAWLPYESSKAAKNRLVYALGYHLREKGIPVIAVAPGWMRTELMLTHHTADELAGRTETPHFAAPRRRGAGRRPRCAALDRPGRRRRRHGRGVWRRRPRRLAAARQRGPLPPEPGATRAGAQRRALTHSTRSPRRCRPPTGSGSCCSTTRSHSWRPRPSPGSTAPSPSRWRTGRPPVWRPSMPSPTTHCSRRPICSRRSVATESRVPVGSVAAEDARAPHGAAVGAGVPDGAGRACGRPGRGRGGLGSGDGSEGAEHESGGGGDDEAADGGHGIGSWSGVPAGASGR